MRLSLSWLKEFVKYKEKPEQVAEILTLGGFEVEKIIRPGQELGGVIVGRIKTITNHAEAERLSVCTVSVGHGQPLKIVCGATNIKVGQKVPVARVGVTLPHGLKIEGRRIRGVDSEGMICSESELGLSDDHTRILILDKAAKIGQKLSTVLGLNDTVLDVTISPNRADVSSVIGLAREFAALAGHVFIEKKVVVPESKKFKINQLLSVRVRDYNLCPQYTARVVKNIKLGPSPDWMQSRLRASGLKPINNIVDVTNYVMMEMGQPLHAFDLDKVKGKKIVVSQAGSTKLFTTLDGVERKLSSDMLMIYDAKDPVAIAGVMGGQNTEISKNTTDVVLESAIFKPLSIRKTRQRLGLATEASNRFERGIWWNLPAQAVDRAAQLLARVASGEVASGMIVVAQEKNSKPKMIDVDLNKINALIGIKFTAQQVISYLNKLSFKSVLGSEKSNWQVEVPDWRQDISISADIVEEVGRMYGWNNLPPTPIYASHKTSSLPRILLGQQKIKNLLMSCGMTESINYSFYGQDLLEQFGWQIADHYRIDNPMNKEQEYLRISLVPQLYVNILKNYQSYESIELFETGNVFYKKKSGLPDERTMVAGVIYNRRKLTGDDRPMRRLQSNLAAMARHLNIEPDKLHYAVSRSDSHVVDVMIGQTLVGWYGWLIQNEAKLGSSPVWFELDIAKLMAEAEAKRRYKQLPAFPAVTRDMTFRVSTDVDYYNIVKAIKGVDVLINDVWGTGLFEESEKKRGATFRIVYQAPSRTLRNEEVNVIEKNIIELLDTKFNAVIKK
ncbi:phenylalanine--tRNA ligase subunit beta [Patescibacteria group bacterium]|nr:phenylalanine--tRNA ligase subunit beta [Patescibacteria group bacterium]